MLLIASPAKKMVDASDDFAWRDLPRLLPRTRELLEALQAMDRDELKALWKCSDALADLNAARVRAMRLDEGLSPAAFSYEGIQYQSMAPAVMTERELAYLQGHLRILSGFYGVLRPFDGVTPYRLELQAKLQVSGARNLYAYWDDALFRLLREDLDAQGEKEERAIVNVASVEYASAVEPFARAAASGGAGEGAGASGGVGIDESEGEGEGATGSEASGGAGEGEGAGTALSSRPIRFVTCLFGTVRDGRLVQRSTEAKSARGSFVRWCAEREVRTTDELGGFDVAGFRLNEALSAPDTLVFTR